MFNLWFLGIVIRPVEQVFASLGTCQWGNLNFLVKFYLMLKGRRQLVFVLRAHRPIKNFTTRSL